MNSPLVLLDLRVRSKAYGGHVSTYAIGEAARRSGFTASALRYYEEIGLVVPQGRTDGGYRIYDETSLARLVFVARAKRLGCSLDEVRDLLAIWEGERCGPVQSRFHELVTAKLADARGKIAELTALIAQLEASAARLGRPAVDGSCRDDCACAIAATEEAGEYVPVTLGVAVRR